VRGVKGCRTRILTVHAMHNVQAKDYLRDKHGLTTSPLKALVPDESLYELLLIQPSGRVMAGGDGVRNNDAAEATGKFNAFLTLASNSKVDLAITPEYSCPWGVIEESINEGRVPEEGTLWLLGCESITPEGLAELADRCGGVKWIYEPVVATAAAKFLDPVCYLFRASDISGRSHVVALVQFKGQPMSDHASYIERDNLIHGTKRYILSNDDNSVALTTLICSDSLAFDVRTLPAHMNTSYLFAHLQLNMGPRHPTFALYRYNLFQAGYGDLHEIICANWAKGFSIGQIESAFGGSALYTKSAQVTLREERINTNHRRGLYYTRLGEHHTHAYYFNYSEHVFHLRTTKPSQRGARAALLRRTGPQMENVYSWDAVREEWRECEPDDGFGQLCKETGGDLAPLDGPVMGCVDKERLLALSNAAIGDSQEWFLVKNLPLFEVKVDEVVMRPTVAQDPCEDCRSLKSGYVNKYSVLRNEVLADPANIPDHMGDLKGKCLIRYPAKPGSYVYNLCRPDGRGLATGAFLGDCSEAESKRRYDRMLKALDARPRMRLVVWYRSDGRIKYRSWGRRPTISQVFLQPNHIAGE
jgi:hypothetical protein